MNHIRIPCVLALRVGLTAFASLLATAIDLMAGRLDLIFANGSPTPIAFTAVAEETLWSI